ncbi:hypothetical protein B0I12_002185 [Microbacterium hydrothermale]|uniref:hypothetical protein n=1 Tax=Microbacterium hydrothermale TaxID=857427 RepID=UPI0022264D58|nr:hypothetical protein [Microbacterium hydrothermale]MCW2165030.1 hypothetical protein [Microbacterium hydrothermale]
MTAIRLQGVPTHMDGPALVAVASALMLLPANAARNVRLHRLAALGMAMRDNDARAISPSGARAILKKDDIGGPSILMLEDPYSEVLVQSVSFTGGPYLVSGGSGEHVISDLEILIDASFRDNWMPDELRVPARQLVQGLLTVSDIVLRRAGLGRGTGPAGRAGAPMEVPGAAKLKVLTDATFITNQELDAHGTWLRMVVDTFAIDAGQLDAPCQDDYTDDRLYATPFLRRPDGYRVVLPLDLAITIRFHLLKFVLQADRLREFGEQFRAATSRRFERMLSRSESLEELEKCEHFSRYLVSIDGKRQIHLIIATDPLVDWRAEMWGEQNTRETLEKIAHLMSPEVRHTYSSAEELLHLVINDGPGRRSFWGIPDVDDADPMLIARSDDLEVILHQEPDGLLGLLLFAHAVENRPGRSMSFSLLDEYSVYQRNEKSFYLSDDRAPDFVSFQVGDGLSVREEHYAQTDRHGVVIPVANGPIIEVKRRYEQDAPEVFVTVPNNSYIGAVIELDTQTAFVTIDLQGEDPVGVEMDLVDCVAYWVRECALLTGMPLARDSVEVIVSVANPELWTRVSDRPKAGLPVIAASTDRGCNIKLTEEFAALLQEPTNVAERELVSVLCTRVFGMAEADVGAAVDLIAPVGNKRMVNIFDQNLSPDMLATRLPSPLTGHPQVDAQVLDELGEWLRSPGGAAYPVGPLEGTTRVQAINAGVRHLFERLSGSVAVFDHHGLLDFLVSQNESLLHEAKLGARLLGPRLACFGENSQTVTELVQHRKEVTAAHRATRFLIEYVSAEPPSGSQDVTVLDFYRILAIAKEIIDLGTLSDFLHYEIADFMVSILESGRLGVSKDDRIVRAIDVYVANAGTRAMLEATRGRLGNDIGSFDGDAFVSASRDPMLAEFGFTLADLRKVCGGLLDLAEADRVTRLSLEVTTVKIAEQRSMPREGVAKVLSSIALTQRSSFLDAGHDCWPWRYNRDLSYIRRPLIIHGEELVFGFRAVYRLGVYWAEMLLSGRLQGRAKTAEMREFISDVRGGINNEFAQSVAKRLQEFGMLTRTSVKKIGRNRIVDPFGRDLGDIDVLAVCPDARAILAVEAKDFEIARTPGEINRELQKLFAGSRKKKATVVLHSARTDWLKPRVAETLVSMGIDADPAGWRVRGLIVTSDPLLTPLMEESPVPVVAFDDLTLQSLDLRTPVAGRRRRRSTGRSH